MQRTLWGERERGEVSPSAAAIHWVCRSTAHRQAPSRGGRGGLSVHRGRWAYCDALTDDRAHEWAPTGGVPIDKLVDWTRALEPLRAHTVRP